MKIIWETLRSPICWCTVVTLSVMVAAATYPRKKK